MDFRFGEDQLALHDLAREILAKEVTPERLQSAESSPDGLDRALWETLARANLLGLAVPESLGGSGLGLLELCLLLAEVGRSVAPIPALESLVLAGLPLAELGTQTQREHWLPRLARGEVILGAVLVDADSDGAARLATRARDAATGFVLDGLDRALWETLARANLLGLAVPESLGGSGLGLLELCLLLAEVGRSVAPIPALESLVLAGLPLAELGTQAQREQWLPRLARGKAILTGALVDAGSGDSERPASRARAEGVELTRQRTSSGEIVCDLELRGVRVGPDDLLGGAPLASGAAARLRDCALAAIAATQLGVCERALEITSAYVTERKQFGVPIGSFQAVQHRAADAYVELAAMRWTTWRAAWLLSRGEPALRETAVAKFWAAEGGARIAASAQHLHAGIGVDLDYPIHRHFLWAKRLELALGAAAPELARLGRDLARTGPTAWA